MAEPHSERVPRTPEEPTPDQVLGEMQTCEPYTVSDFQEKFSDASRWTIQRRLETLHTDGAVKRKKHSANRVSYWIPQQ